MKRQAYRKDANHSDVVSALLAIGVEIEDMAQFNFCVDLLCHYQGRTYWLEIKDENKPPSKRRVTDDGKRFAAKLERHGKKLHIVNNPAEALAIFGAKQTA